VIGPKLRADDDLMRAFEVAAIHDQRARAPLRSHFPEGDFLLSLHLPGLISIVGISTFKNDGSRNNARALVKAVAAAFANVAEEASR
jgi:hypothetical protein